MRVINRLLALLLGIALAAGGALVIIEAVWTWTGSGFVWIHGREWLSSFETTAWSNNQVVAISVAVGVFGLLLLLLELRPHKKREVRFATEDGEWVLARHSAEAHLNRRLQSTVPTSPIKTHISPKARRWQVDVKAKAAQSTQPQLEEAARAELGLLRAPTLKLRVRASGATKASSGAVK